MRRRIVLVAIHRLTVEWAPMVPFSYSMLLPILVIYVTNERQKMPYGLCGQEKGENDMISLVQLDSISPHLTVGVGM